MTPQSDPIRSDVPTPAPGTGTPSHEELQLRREQLQLERDVARAQVAAQRLTAWLTAATIAVSVGVAVVSYLSARQSQLAADRAAFELKAAEIAMQGRAWDVPGRAAALKDLFGDRLSSDFGASFDPNTHGWGRDSRLELMRLIAAHPQEKDQIVAWYRTLFPGDTFAQEFATAPSAQTGSGTR